MSTWFLITYTWLFLIQGSHSATKTWICNTNADDKINWVGGDYWKNCTGFHFPQNFGGICLMSLQKLTTNAIYLPDQGDIELRDNADILFSEDSNTCVMVRGDLQIKDYNDPQCWKNDNEAVPDLERSPCYSDDVVFPENATFNVAKRNPEVFERSYTLRNQKLDKQTWLFLYMYPTSCPEFFSLGSSEITSGTSSKLCRVPDLYNHVCTIRKNWRQISCASPVHVVGHCTLFCGSVLLITADRQFNIETLFNNYIKKDNVDAYYSAIQDLLNTIIYQVTITDRGEFTGNSLDHAQKFYDQVKTDLQYFDIHHIQASFSGLPLTPEKDFQHAIGILLGTLFAVILLFGLMFLFYMGPLEHVDIMKRIPRIPIRRPIRRSIKPFVFAKFENKDDGVTSIAGSIVSLDKAFDNPMYGHQMASTSSGGMMETVEEGKELTESTTKIISESKFSNPLYEEDRMIVEDVDD